MAEKSESAQEFKKRCFQIVNDSFISLGLVVGHKLKLFDTMIEITDVLSPKTSIEIAEKANLKERYVREWLHGMVCSEIIDCDPSGTKFWIAEHRAEALRSDAPQSPFSMGQYAPMFGTVLNKIVECFKPEGPRGLSYDVFDEFHHVQGEFTSWYHERHLMTELVPMVEGLDGYLKNGIKCLDIGCGQGVVSRVLAENYPKSEFWGFDFSKESIDLAKENGKHLKNVHYELIDCAKMGDDLTEQFDYVTAFDAIHDQAYPDKVLSEAFRVLKPGGLLSIVDIKGSSNPYTDLQKYRDTSIFLYSASLFHCTPVSMYFEGGKGLGAMWGMEVAKKMISDAGFIVEKVDDILRAIDIHYVCKKPL